jgi:adenosylhomocysteine nucleosidase
VTAPGPPPDPRLPVAPEHVLVVFAMHQEAGAQFAALASPVLYTGVGKVNAAYRLAKALAARHASRPELVLNFGTAGSPRFPTHALLECTRFVQRDMDVTPLGLPHGHTPFDDVPGPIDAPRRLPDLPAATCGSGDHFVAAHDPRDGDVVDMEAYALAKVCLLEQIPFLAAHADWAANLPRAAEAFRAVYRRLTGDR